MDRQITITLLHVPADQVKHIEDLIENLAALVLLGGGDAIVEAQEVEHVSEDDCAD